MAKEWVTGSGEKIKVLDNNREIHASAVTNKMLEALKDCSSIEGISISSSKEVLDLTLIAHLPLESLTIRNAQVKDFGFLRRFDNLDMLTLEKCGFDDLSLLEHMHRMSILRIINNKTTGVRVPQSSLTIKKLLVGGKLVPESVFLANFPDLWIVEIQKSPGVGEDLSIEVGREDAEPELAEQEWELSTKKQADELYRKLAASDLEALVSERDVCTLKKALTCAIDHGTNLEWIAAHIVEHPDREIAIEGLEYLLSSNRSVAAQHILLGLANVSVLVAEHLLEALRRNLLRDAPTAKAGRFDVAHLHGVLFLEKNASPALAAAFRWYFDQRRSFSDVHLIYYKKLAKVAGKTGSRDLVEPLVDLLDYDRKIIGQEKVLKKNCLTALAQLGNAGDIERILMKVDPARESDDVVKLLDQTISRLSKKVAVPA